jgi:hypothetical protein
MSTRLSCVTNQVLDEKVKGSCPASVLAGRTTHGELEARKMQKIGAFYYEINQ